MGRSLEALLQAVGYDARFRSEPSAAGLDGLLADSRLLLIAPGLSAEYRSSVTDMVMLSATRIPVLELLPIDGEGVVDIQGVEGAPWPCTIEEVQQWIQTALLTED